MKLVSLESIQAELESGSRPRSGVTESEEVPSLGGEQINANGTLREEKLRFITFETFEKIRSGKVSKGDILIVKDGATTGKTAFYNGELAFSKVALNEHVFRLKVDNLQAESKFVYWFLRSGRGQREILKDFRGATVGGISKGFTKKAKIPLPPLEEQKRIAGILDAADILRAKRREALAKLDDLLQSTFLDMFGDPVTNPKGWEETTLPDFSIKFTDGPFGSNLKSAHYVEEGIRVIRLQNIGVGEMVNDDLAFISPEHFATLPRNHCEPCDVIIGTMGDPNLRACIIPSELKQSLNKADCLLMRVEKTKAEPIYVCWLLNCPATVAKALSLVRGQTRGRISMGRLKELKVPLPPLDLQQRFAEIVSSLEEQKAKMRKHLEQLDDLFASLQQRAFRGDF